MLILRSLISLALAGLLLSSATQADAQQEPAPAPRFDIIRFEVRGGTLLTAEQIERAMAPYTGKSKDFADIQRARDALQQAYHDLGHCSVKVTLARLEPQDSVVRFHLVEMPASEISDCLSMVVLDEQPKPRAATQAAGPGGAVAYPYVDVRDPSESPAKPRPGPTIAAKPEPQKPAAPAPQPPSPAAPAQGAQPQTLPGVTVALYVEGGGRGLVLSSDAPATAGSETPAAKPEPAPPSATELVKPASRLEAPKVDVAVVQVPELALALPADKKPALPEPRQAVQPAITAEKAVSTAVPATSPSPPVATPQRAPEEKPVPQPVASAAPETKAPAASSPAAVPEAKAPVTAAPAIASPPPASPETKPAAPKPAAPLAQAEPAKPAPVKPAAEPPKPTPAAPIAEVAPIAAPKFEIVRYLLEGNTLLKPEEFNRVLAPFTGKDKDFGDVQRALEALQTAYQQRGYGGVEVRLPEQELERGEVRFRVIEAKIGKITVEGNERFNAANARRSVPSLREGETPNSREIARSIRLANENPSKQSAVLLRATEREDQVDAAIRVADIDPVRLSVSLDNTGNEATHRYRLGFAYQHANLFDRDHVLTAQFITSPGNRHDVEVYGVGYRIPIYSLGDSIDFVAGYSSVDSGTVQDIFTVAGKGAIYAVRYNQALPKWGDVEHKLSYGLDYRAYQNKVVPVGGIDTLVPDITLHPFSITYSASLRREQQVLSFFLGMSQNVPAANDGKDSDFKKLGARFPDGTAGYRLFRFGGNYSGQLPADWKFRIRLDAQYTDDALIAGEQFAIGGADNVRGFGERYRTDDKGYRTNWELYTPDWAKQLGLDNGRLRFLVFYDTGVVRRNREQPGELEGASLDSIGLGLRMNYKTYFTARLDIAHVYHDGTQFQEATGKRNSKKGHFSLAWVW